MRGREGGRDRVSEGGREGGSANRSSFSLPYPVKVDC